SAWLRSKTRSKTRSTPRSPRPIAASLRPYSNPACAAITCVAIVDYPYFPASLPFPLPTTGPGSLILGGESLRGLVLHFRHLLRQDDPGPIFKNFEIASTSKSESIQK